LGILLNVVGRLGGTNPDAETVPVDFPDAGMHKMGLGHLIGSFRWGIEFPGEKKGLKSFLLEYLDPFLGFQRNTVRTGQTSRDEADFVNLPAVAAIIYSWFHPQFPWLRK
jgi:hypothetical protein